MPGTKLDASPIFTIPEILFLILNDLSAIELLTTARLVCRQWKSTIETSKLLRWKTWNRDILSPPPSLRNQYTSDCDNTCPSPCVDHCYSNSFEVSPLALHLVEQVWQRCMRAQHAEQHNNGEDVDSTAVKNLSLELFSFVGSKLRKLQNAGNPMTPIQSSSHPSANLLRPRFCARNIWIYAGSYRTREGMDTSTYHYNSKAQTSSGARETVQINTLANTLIEGLERKAMDIESPYYSPAVSAMQDAEKYYSLVINAFGICNPKDPDIKEVGDTEIIIKLQMFEPYGIESIETSNNGVDHWVRAAPPRPARITTDWKAALRQATHSLNSNSYIQAEN
ncbi:hypothetical protein H072_6712 [Dactylellina haptotyla CBS 200.50]|uniref:F-box domain-containing protein n=1 Tax=Dactylellina haptotyla (strain CBS 200.50) TaxID=1284197 RepID=S8BW07_DACHA|nr:hypothetical protein H072_6712 [Dactylellina haptotyla CBS 200.50]